MSTKIGPKEQKLRELREAMIKRTEQNNKLLRGKLKMKSVGQVVQIRGKSRER